LGDEIRISFTVRFPVPFEGFQRPAGVNQRRPFNREPLFIALFDEKEKECTLPDDRS
jgi:hypothetical protein